MKILGVIGYFLSFLVCSFAVPFFPEPGKGWIQKIDDNFETLPKRSKRSISNSKPCHNRQFLDPSTSICRSAYELKCSHNSMDFKIHKSYLTQENLSEENIFFQSETNLDSTCYKFIDQNSEFIEVQFYLNTSCETTSEWVGDTKVIYKNALKLTGENVNYIDAKEINFSCDYKTNYTKISSSVSKCRLVKLHADYFYNARCDSPNRDNSNNCDTTYYPVEFAFDRILTNFAHVAINGQSDYDHFWFDVRGNPTVTKIHVYGRNKNQDGINEAEQFAHRSLNLTVTLNDNSVICTSNDVQNEDHIKMLTMSDPPLPFVYECEPTQVYNLRIAGNYHLAIAEVELFACEDICERDYSYDNGCDLALYQSVSSAMDCKILCDNRSDCGLWLYIAKYGNCYLKNPGNMNGCSGYDEGRNRDWGVMAGWKNQICSIPQDCVRDMDWHGCDVASYSSIGSAFECRDLCETNDSCTRWLFVGSWNECHLKNGESSDCAYNHYYNTNGQGHISGLKGQDCNIIIN